MFVRKPDWLKVKITGDSNNEVVQNILNELSLNTVCTEANCPNKMECFQRKTATFMILGRVCTRNCTFCNVTKGETESIDLNEPKNIAEAVKELKLRHVVITSVTRDDLDDGGAQYFVNVINEVRDLNPTVTIEVLIPDFKGDKASLEKIVIAKPHIINHNVETVPSLYSKVRPMAIYGRSLELLKRVKELDNSILTKSGIMVGLGEKEEEVFNIFEDLREIDCNLLTIGQYLAPSKNHHPVIEYVHPDVFKKYEIKAIEMGFDHVASSPLVRSSYHADKAFEVTKIQANNKSV
jgi:lipoic acid synthetase